MSPLAAPPGDACVPSVAPARRPNHLALAVGVLLAALLTWAVAVAAGPTLAPTSTGRVYFCDPLLASAVVI